MPHSNNKQGKHWSKWTEFDVSTAMFAVLPLTLSCRLELTRIE